MANGGESAQGWSLWWDGVTSSAVIAGVTGFQLPSKEGVMVDVTGLESTEVEDDFHVGLTTRPEFEVKINSKSTSAQHIAIMNAAGGATEYEFIVKNAAGDAIATFDAKVTKHNLSLESKDAVRGTFTVKTAESPAFVVSS
jgi:hypothetical protein